MGARLAMGASLVSSLSLERERPDNRLTRPLHQVPGGGTGHLVEAASVAWNMSVRGQLQAPLCLRHQQL